MSIQSEHPWIPTDDFGTRLLLARRELGLSMKEAADRCGLHYSTWSTWENGRKPADMAAVVKAISDGLGVSRGWLMWGGTLTPSSPKTLGHAVTVEYSHRRRLMLAPAA